MESLEYSVAGRIGRTLEVVMKPIGFDWRICSALIGAFAAKELFVSQLGILFSMIGGGGSDSAPNGSESELHSASGILHDGVLPCFHAVCRDGRRGKARDQFMETDAASIVRADTERIFTVSCYLSAWKSAPDRHIFVIKCSLYGNFPSRRLRDAPPGFFVSASFSAVMSVHDVR